MTEPRWKQRYRAPSLTLPRWAPDDPEHLVYVSNQSGSWQVHAWDRAADHHRQVSDHPTGVVAAGLTPDGTRVVWFEDSKGDEVGRWLQQPFEGGETAPLVADAEPAWSAGLALGPKGLVAVGLASRDGFSVRVGEVGGTSEELYRHDEMVDVGGLSRDGRLLVVHHAEHGDNLHPALRAFELETMAPVADLWDGEGFGLFVASAGFSPLAGDGRLAVLGDRSGRLRPAIWDPVAGQRIDLDLELPGEVDVADWWPDAQALLLVHTYMGRDELSRLDLHSGALERLDHPAGSIQRAGVRPDGAVWYRLSSAPARRCCARPGRAPPRASPTRAGRSPTPRVTRSTGSWPCRRGPGPTRRCWSSTAAPTTTTPTPGTPRSRRSSTTATRSGWSTTAAPPATARPGRTCSRATPAGPRSRTWSPAATTWSPAAWPTPPRWSSPGPPGAGT